MFDVEGARKAGYSDGEIAARLAMQASFDIDGAKKAGYTDGDIIAKLAAGARPKAVIPGTDPAWLAGTTPAQNQPPQTFADKAVGTAEAALSTATGAVGGALGMAGGAIGGLAGAVMNGDFGTTQGADNIEQAAASGAQALTYQPRTPAGQEAAVAVAHAFQEFIPVAPILPTMAAPVGAAAGGVRQAGQMAQAVGARGAQAAREVGPAVAERVRPQMAGGGAASTEAAAQRVATAESIGLETPLTRGQATRDPAQLRFEQETSKGPDGARIRGHYAQQNQEFAQRLDSWVDETGAQAADLPAVGRVVDAALKKQMEADRASVRVAYKNAEKQAGDTPVSLDGVVKHLNDAEPDAAIAPLVDVARKRAVRLGIAKDENGQLVAMPTTLATSEAFRKAINNAVNHEAPNIRQASIMKGLIDEATDGLGGELYKTARAERARFAQNYENHKVISNLVELKRGTTDRKVAIEDVFSKSILDASLDDVRQVRRVLQRSGEEGRQAWKELQGQTAAHIRDQALSKNATDQRGNVIVSSDALRKAIEKLDKDGRLDFIFGKQGAQQMRDISELAQYVYTTPPGVVNTSNTASVVLAAITEAGVTGSITGLPVPILTGIKVLAARSKNKKLQKRIDDALNTKSGKF